MPGTYSNGADYFYLINLGRIAVIKIREEKKEDIENIRALTAKVPGTLMLEVKMKQIIASLIIVAFMVPDVFGYVVLSKDEARDYKLQRVSPKDVKSVLFNVFKAGPKSRHDYEGYIVFRNEGGDACTLNSSNMVMVWAGNSNNPPKFSSEKRETVYYKEIIVSSSRFELIRTRTGKVMPAIPLSPFSIKKSKEYIVPQIRFYWKVDGTNRVVKRKAKPTEMY